MTIKEHASKASSQRRSGSRSPALARSIMALAIASRGCSSTPRLRRDSIAISKATPRRRTVSASNLWPRKYCLIGMAGSMGPKLGAVKPFNW